MKYSIEGSTLQSLKIELNKNESIYSESGVLLYMTPNIDIQTNFTKGFWGSLARSFTGNSLLLNHFVANGDGVVSFTTRMPGHVVPLALGHGKDIIVQKHSFLCAQHDVTLELATSFNLKGLFGGNGLLFNKLSGNGLAFISVDGEVIEMELKQGETILAHPGHVAAYESSVSFDLQRQKGFKNMFLSGDGIFLAKMTGPGKVWLHSLSVHSLAEIIAPYIGGERSKAGVVGAVIGGILKG